jgi:transposase-like protein
MTGERQVPFYCPYCGEEDLRPAGEKAGGWECGACSRGFQLSFTAVIRPRPGDSLSRAS